MHFCWHHPCLWYEIEQVWELLHTRIQVAGHVILVGYEVHAYEMIDPLVRLHLVEPVGVDGGVSPANVPFLLHLSGALPFELFLGHLPNNGILRLYR